MTSEQIGTLVIVVGHSVMLLIVIKILGVRRVLVLLFALVMVGLALALRALATVASSER